MDNKEDMLNGLNKTMDKISVLLGDLYVNLTAGFLEDVLDEDIAKKYFAQLEAVVSMLAELQRQFKGDLQG